MGRDRGWVGVGSRCGSSSTRRSESGSESRSAVVEAVVVEEDVQVEIVDGRFSIADEIVEVIVEEGVESSNSRSCCSRSSSIHLVVGGGGAVVVGGG